MLHSCDAAFKFPNVKSASCTTLYGPSNPLARLTADHPKVKTGLADQKPVLPTPTGVKQGQALQRDAQDDLTGPG